MNERIKELRKSLNLTLEEFGKRLGFARSSMSNIENGTKNITDRLIKAICREYNVDYGWLTTGTGEMFVDSDDLFYEKIDRIMASENEFHKNLVKAAIDLDLAELRIIEKLINKCVHNEREEN